MKKILYFSILIFLYPHIGYTKRLKILTTTNNLKNIVEAVTGELDHVESFSKGTQDPHYIEAKPSYMLKASKADLLVSVGFDLEVGWLPLILKGARNPKIRPRGDGSLVAGDYINPLERPTMEITRADGDVHPEGNPHFLLDPLNAIKVAKALKDKLIELSPDNKLDYERNFSIFSKNILNGLEGWKKRVPKDKKVISYHKTLTYFYHRFGIKSVSLLEPKPGVPPSASHILGVIKKARKERIQTILVENYFDPTVADRVAREVKGLKVKIVPVSVYGNTKVKNLFDLYESLVKAVED